MLVATCNSMLITWLMCCAECQYSLQDLRSLVQLQSFSLSVPLIVQSKSVTRKLKTKERNVTIIVLNTIRYAHCSAWISETAWVLSKHNLHVHACESVILRKIILLGNKSCCWLRMVILAATLLTSHHTVRWYSEQSLTALLLLTSLSPSHSLEGSYWTAHITLERKAEHPSLPLDSTRPQAATRQDSKSHEEDNTSDSDKNKSQIKNIDKHKSSDSAEPQSQDIGAGSRAGSDPVPLPNSLQAPPQVSSHSPSSIQSGTEPPQQKGNFD